MLKYGDKYVIRILVTSLYVKRLSQQWESYKLVLLII